MASPFAFNIALRISFVALLVSLPVPVVASVGEFELRFSPDKPTYYEKRLEVAVEVVSENPIVRVEFSVDGCLDDTSTSTPHVWVMDGNYPDGSHILSVLVFFSDDERATKSRNFNLIRYPEFDISAPLENTVVQRNWSVRIMNADDNDGIEKIEMLLDNEASPRMVFSVEELVDKSAWLPFDTRLIKDGDHSAIYRVTDIRGYYEDSRPYRFSTKNRLGLGGLLSLLWLVTTFLVLLYLFSRGLGDYPKFCKGVAKRLPFLVEKRRHDEKTERALEFLEMDITYGEVVASSMATFLGSLLAMPPMYLLITLGLANQGPLIPMLTMIILGGLVFLVFLKFPVYKAGSERVRSLSTMPEAVSYLTMSMKMVPNIERAIQFAARRTRGSIGSRLRKLLWQVQLRIFSTSEEALLAFGKDWREWNEDFEKAIYFIRNSQLERVEARRIAFLDKAMEVVLSGTREKLTRFAKSLVTPSMTLYFVGLVLPVIFLALVPTLVAMMGSEAMGTGPGDVIGSVQPEEQRGSPLSIILVIYNILIPVGLYLGGMRILRNRPGTFPPPEVEGGEELPRKGCVWIGSGKNRHQVPAILVMLAFVPVVLIGIAGSDPALAQGLGLEGTLITFQESGGVPVGTGRILFLEAPIFILLGTSLSLGVYLYLIGMPKMRIRKKVLKMEEDFVHALVLLGSRLGEGRPLEDAMEHVAETMKESAINPLMQRAAINIRVGSMTLRESLMDEKRGALSSCGSDLIKKTFGVIVDSVDKGSESAAETVSKMSTHMENMRDVETETQELLNSVVTGISIIVSTIGPLVAGIAVVMHSFLLRQIYKIAGGQGGGISPLWMQLIVMIFLIEAVVILTWYYSDIKSPGDSTVRNIETGRNLILSSVVYFAVIMMGSMLFGAFGG